MRTIGLIERLIKRAGFVAALILLPCLMLARLTEIVTRSLHTPGSLYNAMEAELFLLFAFLTLGSAMVSDAHVRVDIFRARFGERGRAWIDLLGTLFFVLPFAIVVVWYGSVLTASAWSVGERSAIAFGAPTRWVIVAGTPVGIGLFALAVLCRAARQIAFLRGRGQPV